MGCCLSKKPSPSSNVTSSTIIRSPDPIKPKIEPIEETKPKSQKLNQEEEEEVPKKEALMIKHRRSHEERSKKTESDKDSPVSSPVAAEKPNSTTLVVRISSCTKEEVDAILIQCGKLSRSNSAAKTRRYSGSKRSFDFDQNGGDAAAEEVEEAERQTHRNRHRGVERVNGSPRERRRRTPSRERDDFRRYRSGSRERGNNGGGSSRRVSRSPAKRSEFPNVNSNRPGKFVTIPATDKSNNVELSVKRVTVKRNIGDACRIAASPRSKSPARTGPSLSRSNSRKAEQSPYRRNPLGEIDQNSSRIGSCNNTKKTAESVKPNPRTSRAASPSSRAAAVVEVSIAKPPQVVLKRSRSLRKSRDFDLVSNEDNNYTALLLKDIQNFHGKSVVEDNSVSLLPLCVTKACSIVEAVADLNSMATNNSDSSRFRFTLTANKADLMEPSFEKYVTLKRGGSLEESSGSNNVT
ncbi:PREDICTED: uncharacterized protein At1g65710-like [Camelina sativa]|uniref:Uncharacterized protein At1g65710-like n=1 Tax=Camelina sativa TaxID=90675 RepID=A0ABM0SRK5_CAMSA|nr:PREDICTED: uncharacterized protein At1g65710-like [Camelina sativa]